MDIQFLGAAREVTGSCFLVQTSQLKSVPYAVHSLEHRAWHGRLTPANEVFRDSVLATTPGSAVYGMLRVLSPRRFFRTTSYAADNQLGYQYHLCNRQLAPATGKGIARIPVVNRPQADRDSTDLPEHRWVY